MSLLIALPMPIVIDSVIVSAIAIANFLGDLGEAIDLEADLDTHAIVIRMTADLMDNHGV